MTITVNNLGTYTRQLVISGETSISNIMTEVDNALVALGWTLYDTVTTGSNNAKVTKVYRVLNADATTYKYFGIYWKPCEGLFHTTSWESWNNSTHVGTNEVFTNMQSFPHGVQYSNCSIYIFASARWAVLYSTVRGEYGPWSGVFETEREATEDTAVLGVPCWFWTNSAIIGEAYTPITGYLTTTRDSWCFSPPRTADGFTFMNAAKNTGFVTPFGAFPPRVIIGSQSSGVSGHGDKLGGVQASYAWDATKKPIHVLKAGASDRAVPTGRVFGAKAIAAVGDILDTVVLKTDANKHYDAAGSNTDHWVLPMHGGYWNATSHGGLGANKFNITGYGSGFGTTDMYDGVLIKGKYVYVTYANGVQKIDLDADTNTPIFSGSTCYGIAYDGGDYIYATTGTGIVKIAVADDTYVQLTIGSGGCTAIAIDEASIWVSDRTNSTTPKIYAVPRSTFTTTAGVAPGTVASQTYLQIAVDYAGNAYVANGVGASTAGTRLIYKSTTAYSVSSASIGGTDYSPSNKCLGVFTDGVSVGAIWYQGGAVPYYLRYGMAACSGMTAWFDIASQTNWDAAQFTAFTSVSHRCTPYNGVWHTGVTVAAASLVVVPGASLFLHPDVVFAPTASTANYITGYPTHSGNCVVHSVRNFGSFMLQFTDKDNSPLLKLSGMSGKYNTCGAAAGHILLPA